MTATCPICRHPFEGWPDQCPKCRRWIRPLRPKSPVPWRFDLFSILLMVMVIAIGLGLSLRGNTILLGVPILLIAPATIVRATPIIVHRKLNGKPTEAPDVYLESCLVAGLMLVFGSLAFVAAFILVVLAALTVDDLDVDTASTFVVGILASALASLLVLFLNCRGTFLPKD